MNILLEKLAAKPGNSFKADSVNPNATKTIEVTAL